jgi:hypothetical protein
MIAAAPVSAGTLAAARPAAPAHVRTAHLTALMVRPGSDGASQLPPSPSALKSAEKRAHHLPSVVLPDVFAVAAHGITSAELARLARLRSVRSVLAVDGGAVRIGGRPVSTIGVNPAAFRAWTPARTAAQQGVWDALGQGGLVTTAAAAKALGLRGGASYQVSGASQRAVRFGATADLGIPGVDAVVAAATSQALGLVPQIGVLISAPKADLTTLEAQIRGVIGSQSRFVSLRPARQVVVQQAQTQLAQDRGQRGQPADWLALLRDSAAKYCPGLSWTVLAAIAQIESGFGQNNGPSSAGALGPMQFLPSTWARWGINGFGPPGAPDINNALDAVPSAAVYLCASGGGLGGTSLEAAIFSYNHAAWYVAEVLALAREYSQKYG